MHRFLLLAAVVAVGGCANAQSAVTDIRAPDDRLLAPTQFVPALPVTAEGNAEMWHGYGRCRVAWSTEADLRRGLIDYVTALRVSR